MALRVGAAFILTLTHYSPAQLSAMSAEQFQAYQIVEADTVKTPYLVIGGLFLAVAALIYFSKLPDITEREKQAGSTTKELRGILKSTRKSCTRSALQPAKHLNSPGAAARIGRL